MELSFNDLKKRDVINVADGKCLGRITDIKLAFPMGVLVGIVVPGRKVCPLFKIFDRSEMYIEESKIKKIGGDVILVNINCGDVCAPSAPANLPVKKSACPSPCEPLCPQNSSCDCDE